MEIRFNVTKEERKALVKTIGEITGWEPVYNGAPSFAFAVNNYTIDRDGTLVYNERTDAEDVRRLLAELSEKGFISEGYRDSLPPHNTEDIGEIENAIIEHVTVVEPVTDAPNRLVIEVPFTGFNNTALDNLERLVSGKASLIMKAVGTDALPIERTEASLRFPWFPASASGAEADAYARLIHALCEMAKTQKRVTMKESAVDSEKFAFRCFLLRLGFIGAEYAPARKILLSKLSGSGSYKSGDHKSRDACEGTSIIQSNKEEAWE